MTGFVFFKSWPWPKVVALCGGWAAIVLVAWVLALLRARPHLGPNDFVYRTSFHPNVSGWVVLLGPVALILLLRWRAAR